MDVHPEPLPSTGEVPEDLLVGCRTSLQEVLRDLLPLRRRVVGLQSSRLDGITDSTRLDTEGFRDTTRN